MKTETSLFECSVGVRHRGGVNVDWALVRNVRTCRPDAKGEAQAGTHRQVPEYRCGAQGQKRS